MTDNFLLSNTPPPARRHLGWTSSKEAKIVRDTHQSFDLYTNAECSNEQVNGTVRQYRRAVAAELAIVTVSNDSTDAATRSATQQTQTRRRLAGTVRSAGNAFHRQIYVRLVCPSVRACVPCLWACTDSVVSVHHRNHCHHHHHRHPEPTNRS